jgi:hypothetical protein
VFSLVLRLLLSDPCAGHGIPSNRCVLLVFILRFARGANAQRTCSRQTFSTTYYLKRRELLVLTASGLAACSAHRQIARSAHCAKTSVTRIAERLGRHAMAVGTGALERLFPERIRTSESGLKLYRKQWTPGLPDLNLKHAA